MNAEQTPFRAAPAIVPVLLLFVLLVFAEPSGGQAPSAAPEVPEVPARELTLDSLVAEALRQNPALRAREADLEAARERVPRAGALPDPQVSWEFEGSPIDDPSPAAARENRFRVTQMLPFPGKQGLMKSIAAEEASMAAAERDTRALDLLSDLHRAFYDLWLLYASIDVIEESQRNVRAIVQVARTRYEVGRAMQQDLLKANVELAMEETRLAVLRQRIPAAEAAVNALLNRAGDSPLGRPALSPSAEGTGETLRLDALADRALTVHPMLRLQESAVAIEQRRLRLAGKEGLPDFMVGAGYMAMKDEPDAWMGMLSLTLPIWRGNKVGPLGREARAALASAEAQRQDARNEVLRMVTEAWTMVESARTMALLYADSVLPQAEQSLSSARVGYETDRGGFLDLLDAQRSLLGLRLEYEEARAEYLKSRAGLARAVGDPAMLGGGR